MAKVLDQLLEQPVLAAQLLNNEMAEDIEGIFREAGLSSSPRRTAVRKPIAPALDWHITPRR